MLTTNILFEIYSFHGSSLYEFDIIQIVIYSITIILNLILSFYSLFKPNDFAIISEDMYIKLRKSTLLFNDPGNESIEKVLLLTINISGYKIKNVMNTSTIHYNINICVNNLNYYVSRTLVDFYSLDRALRENFPKSDFPNLIFPEFSMDLLKKCTIEERAAMLGAYLQVLCSAEFMTSDLLNFLQIEGDYRDSLAYKHNLIIEELLPNSEGLSRQRAESKILDYYNPSVIQPIENESNKKLNLK